MISILTTFLSISVPLWRAHKDGFEVSIFTLLFLHMQIHHKEFIILLPGHFSLTKQLVLSTYLTYERTKAWQHHAFSVEDMETDFKFEKSGNVSNSWDCHPNAITCMSICIPLMHSQSTVRVTAYTRRVRVLRTLCVMVSTSRTRTCRLGTFNKDPGCSWRRCTTTPTG